MVQLAGLNDQRIISTIRVCQCGHMEVVSSRPIHFNVVGGVGHNEFQNRV